MLDMSALMYYSCVIGTILLPAGGVALGQGRIGRALAQALNAQPHAANQLASINILALALSETSAILCLLMGIVMLMSPVANPISVWSSVGIFFALGIPGFVSGYVSSQPAKAALESTARQPFERNKILNLMLLGLVILQTPVILGLVISLLIKTYAIDAALVEHIKLCAAGIALGLGSLGPTIGLSIFSRTACRLLGTHPNAYRSLINFAFVSQALIETPILFCFIIAFLSIFTPVQASASLAAAAPFVASACAMALTTGAAGISSGKTAAKAAHTLVHHPNISQTVTRMSLIAQTLIDTQTIYGLLVAFLLIVLR
jgi:F-type H+-transporting ATPase subunit c